MRLEHEDALGLQVLEQVSVDGLWQHHETVDSEEHREDEELRFGLVAAGVSSDLGEQRVRRR